MLTTTFEVASRYLSAFASVLLVAGVAWGGGSRDFEATDAADSVKSDAWAQVDDNATGTIALWLKAETVAGIYQTIYAHSSQASNNSRTSIGIDTTSVVDCGVRAGLSNNEWYLPSSITISAGVWYFIACVQEGDTSPLLYIDAVDRSGVLSTPVGDGSEWLDQHALGSYPLQKTCIGVLCRITDGSYLDGLVAYVHEYDRPLSQGELQQLMHCPGSIRRGLEIYYPLVADTATAQKDYSGFGNHQTLGSGSVSSTDGPPVSHCALTNGVAFQ